MATPPLLQVIHSGPAVFVQTEFYYLSVMIRPVLICISLLMTASGLCQKDSLLRVFHNPQLPDSVRMKAMGDLAWNYTYNNVDSAVYYAYMELTAAKEKNLVRWQIDAHNTLGNANITGGKLKEALNQYSICESLSRKSGNKRGVATAQNNMGTVYYRQGNLALAVQYYLKALSFFEGTAEKTAIAHSYNNIGTVYREMDKIDKAYHYFQRSLKLFTEVSNTRGVSIVLNNLGMVQSARKNFRNAISYFSRSLQLKEELNDTYGLINGYLNIGGSYLASGRLDSAEVFFIRGLTYAEELHDEHGYALLCSNMGELSNERGEFAKAVAWCKKGLTRSERANIRAEIKANCSCLHTAYEGLGDYRKALAYYMRFIAERDSIANQEKLNEITQREMQFNFARKTAADSVRNAQRDKLHRAELHARNSQIARDQVLRYSLGAVLVLAILFGIFIYSRFKHTRKQRELMRAQKEMVSEKNREILDSINYSKRIQESILPADFEIAGLLPQAFVFYRPKDIVSGDFYFIEPIRTNTGQKLVAFAAADSTGHGVPGAFMSILGTSILKQSLVDREVNSPAQALDFLNRHLHISLRHHSRSEHILDGMDVAFCVLDPTSRQLYFSGANNPLWIVKSSVKQPGPDDFIEIKGDKQPIGYFENQKPFKNHAVQLETGDMVYIFTDGFADQFGGPQGKKFKYKQLKEHLIKICTMDVQEQRSQLAGIFEDWKSGFEQTDDVCLIGVRV